MSKAFTRETDGSDDDALEEDVEPRPLVGKRYITREGYERIQTELDQLWRVERPRVTREVEAAAALGDRSENAEYIYGKRRLREIDRRLRYLAKRIDALTVVEAPPGERDKIFFGAYVTVEDDEGVRQDYRLVGADEIDLAKRWISPDSPVGQALLGKRVGDVVAVRRPKGEVELEIVAVRYE